MSARARRALSVRPGFPTTPTDLESRPMQQRWFLLVVSVVLLLGTGCPSGPHQMACDPPCGEFQQCIDGICRDLNCNPPCRSGRVCVNGLCLRTCDPSNPVECGLSETCCAHLKACVNTDNDPMNCGACGEVCPEVISNFCSDGRCGCQGWSSTPCLEGQGCCPRADDPSSFECVELMTDPENCGSCGHSCGGLDCVDGECKCSQDDPCPTTEECCPDGCRNLQTDPHNCGACGAACDEGEDCCDGQCVNTLVDHDNCGLCGNRCGDEETCCIGDCTNTATDPFNCGDCFVDCGAGGSCSDGHCQ